MARALFIIVVTCAILFGGYAAVQYFTGERIVFPWESGSQFEDLLLSQPRRAPLAASIDVRIIQTRRVYGGFPEVAYQVLNRSERYANVYVDCEFLDSSGAIVGATTDVASAVPPKSSKRGRAVAPERYARFTQARCLVSDAFEAS